MGWFISGGLLVLLSLVGFASLPRVKKNYKAWAEQGGRGEEPVFTPKGLRRISLGVLGAGLALAVPSTFYTQDPGEAIVLRSITGEVVGSTMEEGFHVKAPWVSARSYNIRNEQVMFAAPSGDTENAGNNGPQITVQDREGVTANIDITVRYSIAPDAVVDIYRQYGTQENFVAKFIENDIRAGVRTVPALYGTLELLNNRADVESEIRAYLEERWQGSGVLVQTVSLQEIRYSDEVKARFDAAQASRIEVEKAQADLEATQVSAQQKIVQAEAEAEANRILTASLTDAVLRQRYLDTLAELARAGNLVITDGASADVLIQR